MSELPFVFTPKSVWETVTLELTNLETLEEVTFQAELAPLRDTDEVPDDVLGTLFAPFDRLNQHFRVTARPSDAAIGNAFRKVVKEYKQDGGELPPREKLEAIALGLAQMPFGWLRSDNSVTLFSSKLGQSVNRDYLVAVNEPF